jgi:hypothetical protein
VRSEQPDDADVRNRPRFAKPLKNYLRIVNKMLAADGAFTRSGA